MVSKCIAPIYDRGRGSYIGATHRTTVYHTIYAIVYGLRISGQISPGLLATGAFYFSLRLSSVFGLFLGLVYYCDDGEWRNEYLCLQR